jgi:hypothetical protein
MRGQLPRGTMLQAVCTLVANPGDLQSGMLLDQPPPAGTLLRACSSSKASVFSSPQRYSTSIGSAKVAPNGVRLYSTFGGATVNTVRSMDPGAPSPEVFGRASSSICQADLSAALLVISAFPLRARAGGALAKIALLHRTSCASLYLRLPLTQEKYSTPAASNSLGARELTPGPIVRSLVI